MAKSTCTATGYACQNLPRGKRRDELLVLIRLGQKFKGQHIGKRPGALSALVLDCARRAGPPYSFAGVLHELELEAARRAIHGEQASPVEKLDRIFELATVHIPRQGRVQVPFATIRNHLTAAKIKLCSEIPACR